MATVQSDDATFDSTDDWSFTLFDGEGRAVISTSPGGSWSKTVYNGAGMVLASVSHDAEADPPETRVTTYEYDDQGRQIAVTDPDGNTTQTIYGASTEGRTKTVIDPCNSGTGNSFLNNLGTVCLFSSYSSRSWRGTCGAGIIYSPRGAFLIHRKSKSATNGR